LVDFSNLARASRNLPQPVPDTSEIEMRCSRYGDQTTVSLIPTKHVLSDEGSYFVATNATPGTAVLYPLTTGFTDTVPFLYVYNNDKPTNPAYKRVFLDYIKIVIIQAPANSTQSYFAIKLDTVARSLGTNNTAAVTPVSPNMDITPTSVTTLNIQSSATASAITAASASARVGARGAFGGLPIAGDELVVICGSADVGAYSGLTAAQAVCPGRKCSNSPPILLGPGQSATMHLWFPGNSTTALTYELEMAWWER